MSDNTFANLTPADVARMKAAQEKTAQHFAKSLQMQLLGNFMVRSCLNCELFRESRCTLAGQTPPPDVLMYGCERWTPDIPF